MISIYTLVDPRTDLVRYVGQTSNPKVRYRNHLKGNKYRSTHTTNWIQGLLDLGLKPKMIEIDICEIKDIDLTEQNYIKLYKSFGCKLTNHSIGGHSSLGCKHSLESRINRSIKQKGRLSNISPDAMINKKKLHSEYLKNNPNQRIDNILPKEVRHKAAIKGNKIASEKAKIKVLKFDLCGNLICEYESIKEASILNNINKDTMRNRCNGKYSQKGY
jgi:hypothetical protein